MRSLAIEHQGRTQSLKAWCQELGLNYATALGRRLRGQPVERVLAPGPGARKRSTLTFNGETMTLRGWAKKLGCRSHFVLQVRLDKGWSIERTLTTTVKIASTT